MAVESKSEVARLLAQNRRQKTTISRLQGEVNLLTEQLSDAKLVAGAITLKRRRYSLRDWWRTQIRRLYP